MDAAALSVNLRRALVRPLSGDKWALHLFVGGLALLLGVLVVPLLYVGGQLAAVLRNGRQTPIGTGIPALLGDGLRILFISIVYLLVPLIVGIGTVWGSIVDIVTGSDEAVLLGLARLLLGGGLTAGLTVAFGYALIGAVSLYATHGKVRDAFAVRELIHLLRDRSFLFAYGASLVLLFLVGILVAIPVLGWIISPFAIFYALIAGAGMWREGCAIATRTNHEDSVS